MKNISVEKKQNLLLNDSPKKAIYSVASGVYNLNVASAIGVINNACYRYQKYLSNI